MKKTTFIVAFSFVCFCTPVIGQEQSSTEISDRIRSSLEVLEGLDGFSFEQAAEEWLASQPAVEVPIGSDLDRLEDLSSADMVNTAPGEFGYVVSDKQTGRIVDIFNANAPVEKFPGGDLVILGYQPPSDAQIMIRAGADWDDAKVEWLRSFQEDQNQSRAARSIDEVAAKA